MSESTIDQELNAALDRSDEMSEAGLNRSAVDLSGATARRAKEHGQLLPYLRALFDLMVHGQSVLEYDMVKDAAIAAIALLENESAAAEFQPGYDERQFRRKVNWMLPCCYDNLAEATAATSGYNSKGLHKLIGEGIAVAERVGKRSCVTCFREYASDVFRQADDLEMSMFHARRNLATAPKDGRNDRRVIGGRQLADRQLLAGRPRAAARTLLKGERYIQDYHDPDGQYRLLVHIAFEIVSVDPSLRTAEGAALESLLTRELKVVPDDENRSAALDAAMQDALADVIRGDAAAAALKLALQDANLLRMGILDDWFEVRLRRIGALRLAGRADEAEQLGAELQERASQADDYLTLRRLRTLPQLTGVPAALALLSMPVEEHAPSASDADGEPLTRAAPPVAADSPSAGDDAGDEDASAERPAWHARMDAIVLASEEHEEDSDEPTLALLRFVLEEQSLGDEGAGAMRCLWLLARFANLLDDAQAAWDWARRQSAADPDDGELLSSVAHLGGYLVERDPPVMGDRLDADAVTRLFERAVHLAPENAYVHARLGSWYERSGRNDDAERALARSHRLDRENPFVALNLADLYEKRNSQGDALEVLDLCLRAGSKTPQVAWEAILLAYSLSRWEALVSYVERYEAVTEGEAWAQYYAACAHLELERWDACLAACATERERGNATRFGVLAIEAAALAGRGDRAAADERVSTLLATPLSAPSGLTRIGLCAALGRAQAAAKGGPHEQAIRRRAFGAGLVQNSTLREERMERERVKGVRFFEITLRQELSKPWGDYPECLAGDEAWTATRVKFGVLAHSQDEATAMLLCEFSDTFEAPPEVESIQEDDDTYTDRPGIMWQSYIIQGKPKPEQKPEPGS